MFIIENASSAYNFLQFGQGLIEIRWIQPTFVMLFGPKSSKHPNLTKDLFNGKINVQKINNSKARGDVE